MDGSRYLAHRFSYSIVHGEIPDGFDVCHKCDNPPCVNPKHLFLGTHKQNMADAVAKKRQARGSKAGLAKLTEKKVSKIKALYSSGGYSHRSLGRKFGVDGSQITRLLSKKQWRHV